MKALGMIEVYGYLAAVEALDTALKAAAVNLLNVTRVQGGLVSVLVVGDVGAVKAAIDAAAAAADRVGEVISVHVIPRPSDGVERMLGADPVGPFDAPPKPPLPPQTPPAPPPEPEPAPAPEQPEAEVPAEEEEPSDEDALFEETDSEHMEPEPEELTEESMQGMTVVGLRNAARNLGITTMTRKEIRFAKKEELVAAILAHQAQE